MRNLVTNVLSAADHLTTNGSQIDANQLVSASFQAVFGDATAAGTFKLQASNDNPAGVYPYQNFVATNWTDIPSQTASVTSGSSALLTIANMCYRWIRAVYTTTAAGIQTVAPIADTGVKQVQTVTTVADVAGSLKSTYFLLSSINSSTKVAKNFYVWFDNGSGVDPAIPGRTGVQVTYTNGDTASTIATAIRSALNALTSDFVATGATNVVISTNVAPGPATIASDGTGPGATGFAFANTTPGVASNLNSKYFLLNSGNNAHLYYVWFNVSSIGTDPTVAGRTAIPIAISAGDTAATIGTAIASAVAAIGGAAVFTATGTTTVTITNLVSGPFVAASDGTAATGFTFAVTGGGSTTVNVSMNALSI